MKKEVLLYAKYINDRYDYIQMMHNGLTKAIKDRDITMKLKRTLKSFDG